MTLFSKEAHLLLTAFATIFFSGFLLANPILIGASFIPIFLYLMGVYLASPSVQIKRAMSLSSARLGEIVEVKIWGKINGGPGAVVICDDVPKYFQLVKGSNYKVVSKGFKEKTFDFSYKIRCTKCGTYPYGLGWETRHIFGLSQTQMSVDRIEWLKIFPVAPKLRRIRLFESMTPRVHPTGSIAKIGPLSTDFKEIRNYVYGDPFKIINWKASARAAGWGKTYPLVNEYEREGKLSIWLFLDAHPELEVGTSIENALEYCTRAAYNAAYYFLQRGYSLGMYIYNHQGETFPFDTGKKQFIKIADGLLRLTAPEAGLQVFWDEGFSKAVERNRRYLITRSPEIIIFTHVTQSNYKDLMEGLRKILVYKRKRREPDIVVINVIPYDFIPKVNDWEIFAAKMLDKTSRTLSNQLRNLGLVVLDWNPKKQGIEEALLTTVRLR